MSFFLFLGILLSVIMIDSAEPANITANSTQTNEGAIGENKSTERTARVMKIKKRLAEMLKEADENKHRQSQGETVWRECDAAPGPSNVVSTKLLTPSIYTPKPESKWQDQKLCPRGYFVNELWQVQNADVFDYKGVIQLGFKCVKRLENGLPSADDFRNKWIYGGGGAVRHDQLNARWFNPCPLHAQWATAAQVVFKNVGQGAIYFLIGCKRPQDPKEDVVWQGQSLPVFKKHNNPDAEVVYEYCDVGQAICGLRTSFEENGMNDASGINEVEINCCPFEYNNPCDEP